MTATVAVDRSHGTQAASAPRVASRVERANAPRIAECSRKASRVAEPPDANTTAAIERIASITTSLERSEVRRGEPEPDSDMRENHKPHGGRDDPRNPIPRHRRILSRPNLRKECACAQPQTGHGLS